MAVHDNRHDTLVIAADTETTGLTDTDRIFEIAAVPVRWEESSDQWVNAGDPLLLRMDPGVAMNERASEVTGITTHDLQGFPPARKVWPEFILWVERIVKENHCRRLVMLGHNLVKFDMPRILRDIHHFGFFPGAYLVAAAQLDSLLLARTQCPGAWRKNLTELYMHAFGRGFDDAHSALADTEATVAITFHDSDSPHFPLVMGQMPLHPEMVAAGWKRVREGKGTAAPPPARKPRFTDIAWRAGAGREEGCV